ncbi:hypothetical protein [Pyxidicoccus xibeiensis]|uniref:hypothetical protein n=1 Tax=Pyxidicoccus xibeiensis TaxID=2906759 RepID=UPI0020A6EF79|nr:hypothetical protein [Pyxidicoccus xibeiensis]MCP3137636.1 hypothetical protein [Pyxidicoccus xibeiensis]
MTRWVKRLAIGFTGMFFLLCFISVFASVWVFQVPVLLVTGWAFFLHRVLPQVAWDWSAIAQTVAVVVVLGAGGHAFARQVWRQARPEDPRPWPARWTVSLLGLLVLLFCATMATVGIGHHVGWLSTSREPLLVSTWPFLEARRLMGEGEDLCTEARKVLERDPTGASLSQALLSAPGLGEAAEKRHTVLVSAPDGARALVVFARDPRQREEEGVVRCGLPGKQAHHPVSALPRLLAGESVAEGSAY